MAVVTKYGTGYKDPASLLQVDAVYAEARVRAICSKIDIANGDSIASLYYVGKVPSNAIILPNSAFYFPAIAGVTILNVGFTGALQALINTQDITTAGSQTIAGKGTVTPANMIKRAWELAGLTSDPGGMLDVVASLGAAATAAGSVMFALAYAKL